MTPLMLRQQTYSGCKFVVESLVAAGDSAHLAAAVTDLDVIVQVERFRSRLTGHRLSGGCLCLGAGDGLGDGACVSVLPAAVLDDAFDAPAVRRAPHVVGVGAAQQVELAVG